MWADSGTNEVRFILNEARVDVVLNLHRSAAPSCGELVRLFLLFWADFTVSL